MVLPDLATSQNAPTTLPLLNAWCQIEEQLVNAGMKSKHLPQVKGSLIFLHEDAINIWLLSTVLTATSVP